MVENPAENELFRHVHSSRPVDEVFLERLRILDPGLEPRWNPLKCRWEIWRQGKYIMTVQTVSGEYAPLDNRVLQKLFLADTHRYKNEFDFIRSLHLEDEHLMRMKRHEQDEYIRACHRDMKPFMFGRKSVTVNKATAVRIAKEKD